MIYCFVLHSQVIEAREDVPLNIYGSFRFRLVETKVIYYILKVLLPVKQPFGDSM